MFWNCLSPGTTLLILVHPAEEGWGVKRSLPPGRGEDRESGQSGGGGGSGYRVLSFRYGATWEQRGNPDHSWVRGPGAGDFKGLVTPPGHHTQKHSPDFSQMLNKGAKTWIWEVLQPALSQQNSIDGPGFEFLFWSHQLGGRGKQTASLVSFVCRMRIHVALPSGLWRWLSVMAPVQFLAYGGGQG